MPGQPRAFRHARPVRASFFPCCGQPGHLSFPAAASERRPGRDSAPFGRSGPSQRILRPCSARTCLRRVWLAGRNHLPNPRRVPFSVNGVILGVGPFTLEVAGRPKCVNGVRPGITPFTLCLLKYLHNSFARDTEYSRKLRNRYNKKNSGIGNLKMFPKNLWRTRRFHLSCHPQLKTIEYEKDFGSTPVWRHGHPVQH